MKRRVPGGGEVDEVAARPVMEIFAWKDERYLPVQQTAIALWKRVQEDIPVCPLVCIDKAEKGGYAGIGYCVIQGENGATRYPLIRLSEEYASKEKPLLQGILGHEIGHVSPRMPRTQEKWKRLRNKVCSVLLIFVLLLSLILIALVVRGDKNVLIPFELLLVLAGIIVVLICDEQTSWPVSNYFQREEEYFADEYAFLLTQDLQGNVARLRMIEQEEQDIIQKWGHVNRNALRLFTLLGMSTHPAPRRREKRLREIASGQRRTRC